MAISWITWIFDSASRSPAKSPTEIDKAAAAPNAIHGHHPSTDAKSSPTAKKRQSAIGIRMVSQYKVQPAVPKKVTN